MNSKKALLAALTVALAVPVAAACAQSSAHPTRSRPTLTLAGRHPMLVRGASFTPHVRVRLLVTVRRTLARSVVPNAGGAFTASFASVGVDRCTRWSVRAIQSGHAPVLIGGAQPMCAPAGSP
jgi:hypothetical protein